MKTRCSFKFISALTLLAVSSLALADESCPPPSCVISGKTGHWRVLPLNPPPAQPSTWWSGNTDKCKATDTVTFKSVTGVGSGVMCNWQSSAGLFLAYKASYAPYVISNVMEANWDPTCSNSTPTKSCLCVVAGNPGNCLWTYTLAPQ